MAGRSLRDRFLTPQVARAMMSPLGILLFGAGTAIAIALGLPILGAGLVGVGAWAGNVAVHLPRDDERQINAAELASPWRDYVVSAQDAKRRFDDVVDDMEAGPLRGRLDAMAGRLDDGVEESWRIAKRGNNITQALGRLTTDATTRELAAVQAQAAEREGGPTSAMRQTIKSLQAQLDSANRLESVAIETQDRLRLLDARFDELVARAVEVSVGTGDSDVLGHEVDVLVDELESLRVALDETEQAASGRITPIDRPSSTT